MAKKKLTTKKRDRTIEGNKVRNEFQLHDNELSKVSVEYVYQLFMLRQKERGNSKATITFYENFFKKYFAFLETFEGKETSIQILMLDGMRSVFEITLGNVNEQTINSYLRGYRAFGNFAEEEGFITGFHCPIKEKELPAKDCYTKKEQDKLTVKPDIRDMIEFRNYTIVCLLLATGIRASNILNMRIKDVNLEEGYIHLPRTKTGVVTTLPLERKAKLALQEYISYWRNVNEGDTEPEDYLFCNCYGEPLTRGGLSCAIASYNRSRGVEKTSIHLFRHTFAKDWITGGGDIISLSAMLTHKELDMVKHYANLYPVDLKDKVEQFSSSAQLRQRSGKTLTTQKREKEQG